MKLNLIKWLTFLIICLVFISLCQTPFHIYNGIYGGQLAIELDVTQWNTEPFVWNDYVQYFATSQNADSFTYLLKKYNGISAETLQKLLRTNLSTALSAIPVQTSTKKLLNCTYQYSMHTLPRDSYNDSGDGFNAIIQFKITHSTVSFDTMSMYLYIDLVFSVLRDISTHSGANYNATLIVWETPAIITDMVRRRDSFNSYDSSVMKMELFALYQYLLDRYIVHRCNIVLKPSTIISISTTNTVKAAAASFGGIIAADSLIGSSVQDYLMHLQSWMRTAATLLSHTQYTYTTVTDIFVGSCSSNTDNIDNINGKCSLQLLCGKFIHTRKCDSRCMPPPPLSQVASSRAVTLRGQKLQANLGTYQLLVTGLGGSGTHFIANTLRGAGFAVAHEGMDSYGSVSWLYAINDWTLNTSYPYGALSSYLLPPASTFLSPRFRRVVHLVRSPARQISAFTAHSDRTYAFVWKVLQSVLQSGDGVGEKVEMQFEKARELQVGCPRGAQCNLYFAALVWLHWNRLVHSYADATYRVEDLAQLHRDICKSHTHQSNEGLSPSQMAHQASGGIVRTEQYMRCVDSLTDSARAEKYRITGTSALSTQLYDFLLGAERYEGSAAHKKHLSYRLSDIEEIDKDLAESIRHDAVFLYGYTEKEL